MTGKRYYGHSGKDNGANEQTTLHYYDLDQTEMKWQRKMNSTTPAGKGPGTGLQIRIADLDESGWKDLVVPGKSGTYILWNQGWKSPN